MADERVQRRLAAIMVADIVGYSRQIEVDEEGTRARLRSLHSELIDPLIAIARAMINDPRVILADEPTGFLDRRAALEIMAEFQRFNDEGRTIILITHDPAVAGFARRRVLILHGTVIGDEAVEQSARADALLARDAAGVLQ